MCVDAHATTLSNSGEERKKGQNSGVSPFMLNLTKYGKISLIPINNWNLRIQAWRTCFGGNYETFCICMDGYPRERRV